MNKTNTSQKNKDVEESNMNWSQDEEADISESLKEGVGGMNSFQKAALYKSLHRMGKKWLIPKTLLATTMGCPKPAIVYQLEAEEADPRCEKIHLSLKDYVPHIKRLKGIVEITAMSPKGKKRLEAFIRDCESIKTLQEMPSLKV